ncbi:MAG: hypothetical protein Q9166_006858 [cf. Caloplaca sp. 2 TL-2023]
MSQSLQLSIATIFGGANDRNALVGPPDQETTPMLANEQSPPLVEDQPPRTPFLHRQDKRLKGNFDLDNDQAEIADTDDTKPSTPTSPRPASARSAAEEVIENDTPYGSSNFRGLGHFVQSVMLPGALDAKNRFQGSPSIPGAYCDESDEAGSEISDQESFISSRAKEELILENMEPLDLGLPLFAIPDGFMKDMRIASPQATTGEKMPGRFSPKDSPSGGPEGRFITIFEADGTITEEMPVGIPKTDGKQNIAQEVSEQEADPTKLSGPHASGKKPLFQSFSRQIPTSFELETAEEFDYDDLARLRIEDDPPNTPAIPISPSAPAREVKAEELKPFVTNPLSYLNPFNWLSARASASKACGQPVQSVSAARKTTVITPEYLGYEPFQDYTEGEIWSDEGYVDIDTDGKEIEDDALPPFNKLERKEMEYT